MCISVLVFLRPDLLYYIGYCTLRYCSYDNHGEHRQQFRERELLFDMFVASYLKGEIETDHGEELTKQGGEIRRESQECVICSNKQKQTT